MLRQTVPGASNSDDDSTTPIELLNRYDISYKISNACVVKGAFKMMERLNIKREKIADIQDVIHEGDINKDGVVDFEEWRTKMKK